jgi:hypothetical protein
MTVSVQGMRLKFALPQGTVILRHVMNNIFGNLRNSHEAKVVMVPLVHRAYTIVNETGILPVKDYPADEVFLERQ